MAHKFSLPAMFAGLLVAGAFIAASCGDDDDSSGGNAQVLSAINILDKAGLHDIDTETREKRTIPASAATTFRQLQALTILTDWPTELEDEAEALADIFGEAVNLLSSESPDLTRAGEATKKAHDAEHDFSSKVFAHLYEEAGIETGGSGHSD